MALENDWITVKEAARLSGYNQQYLRRMIRTNRLKARKFGPIWQVSRSALITYMQKATQSEDQRFGPKTD